MPKKFKIYVPMKIEVRIRTKPLMRNHLAGTERPWVESPRVRDKKIGVLPIGLTIGNNAPITRRVFFARSSNTPGIIVSNITPMAACDDRSTPDHRKCR